MSGHPLLDALPTVRAIASEFGCRTIVRRCFGQPTQIEIVDGVPVEIHGRDLVVALDDDIPKHLSEHGDWVELDDGDELRWALRSVKGRAAEDGEA